MRGPAELGIPNLVRRLLGGARSTGSRCTGRVLPGPPTSPQSYPQPEPAPRAHARRLSTFPQSADPAPARGRAGVSSRGVRSGSAGGAVQSDDAAGEVLPGHGRPAGRADDLGERPLVRPVAD